MKRRYSIWGRQWDVDHDVELVQVDSNPQPVLKGLEEKTVMVRRDGARKRSRMPKFLNLRIVENNHA